ncbi:glycosyltransferase family 4 protein [Synechococcus sp. UW140]|uniref:glycosyltransferase family 4 protein n=2 Tax=Synechococcus sp. UW140 TaxID=368503 RepID=UPI0025F9E2AD|nr:glycosyltransferase family 4 protein [Synechococcus sp. UW140]
MRIAWLGKKSPFCGNVSYGLAVTEALKERGHGISFIHFDTPERFDRAEPDQESSGNLEPEVALPYLMKSQMYTIPSPRASRELRESLERFQPDLVHASLTLSPLDFRLPELCQQLGVPLVATFHPPFDAGLRNITAGGQQLTYQLYASSLAKFDRVVVFSELQAELLIRLGVAKNTLAVIPNGVDPNIWRPGASQLSERFSGKRVFLYMGRLATEKNVEALLRAWKLVQLPGCVLVVVGDGPLRQQLQASHSSNNVIWWGYEADQAIRLALLQVAEVFMLPSLVEGLSLALLEAMASGTACVATDAGADGEVLEGGAGIVISTQGVTTQLRTLLPVLRDQPILSKELGKRARERVLERYTLQANIDALEQLYCNLIPNMPLAA